MLFHNLTDDNIELYTMKHYDNPQCTSMKDYQEDMKTFKYIKRLLNQYNDDGQLKEKLLLKHFIILYNIFAPEPGTRILFYKVDETFYPTIKTFLVYLNFMPIVVKGIRGQDIISSNIQLDEVAVTKLRLIRSRES